MDPMAAVLRAHARQYPAMEPVDAVKLLYQSEFGGGHLIRDERACLAYLEAEYRATCQQRTLPLWEDIGGGMVRVFLASLDAHNYPLAQLGQDFLRSAACVRGTLDRFQQRLDLLRDICREGAFSFSPEALEDYLTGYAQAGYPMVSHSDAYRKAYRPAYRVVSRDCLSVPESL